MAQNAVEYKLVVLGELGAGKSSLTIQFMQNHFVEYWDLMAEECFRRQLTVDQEVCALDVWDTFSNVDISPMREMERRQFVARRDGYLIVYSTIDRHTFAEVANIRNDLLRLKDVDLDPGIVPIVLVGTMSDLAEGRQISTREGEDLARAWGVPFFETSAKERVNVDECFFELVRLVRARRRIEEADGSKRKRGDRDKVQCVLQ